jgi:hypothetical protein
MLPVPVVGPVGRLSAYRPYSLLFNIVLLQGLHEWLDVYSGSCCLCSHIGIRGWHVLPPCGW